MLKSNYPLFIDFNLSLEGELPQEEAHHALHVLRIKPGQKINLTNGNGLFAEAIVEKISKNQVFYSVEHQCAIPAPKAKIHLAVAPTKNIDRYEFMVEKCTEIGLNVLTPVICHNSERKVLKTDRIERIVAAAVKQSLKPYLPVIHPTVGFSDFIKQITACSCQKYIAVCHDLPKKEFFQEIQKDEDALILIGPEGDFSETEIENAINSGFIPVSLGNERLRTETAGIVACHTFMLRQSITV